MNGPRLAVKVGLFVILGLMVLGAMLVIFSKGAGWFRRSYELQLRATTVSGLSSGAVVQMSGVPIGKVTGARFGPEGKGVLITIQVNQKYQIHADARFVIEQIGFLGDQYVAIYPQENKAPVLTPGSVVPVQEPFNIQATVRSATDLLNEFKQTAQIINELVARLDKSVLSENSLTNAAVAINNFRFTSERTLSLVDGVSRLVETNSHPIFISVSNLVRFSEQVGTLADELTGTIATNKTEFTKAVQSLTTTSQVLQQLARSLESAQGMAGAMIKDPKLKASLAQVMQNLETVTSNINKYGLLYKPKQPKPRVSAPALPPKEPFK